MNQLEGKEACFRLGLTLHQLQGLSRARRHRAQWFLRNIFRLWKSQCPGTKLVDELLTKTTHQAVHLRRSPEDQTTFAPVRHGLRYSRFGYEQRNRFLVDVIRGKEALSEADF